ncbi:hypothetical protein [Mesonia sp. K7]|uniref:hypothetical protein n=1 Tax=Mesonia sp. K7 TaxID=2218606 RepID=UPI000DAA6C48|nr:hypothetical protein [Mesonia sp. K7]PZD77899.1 hypothetical protein DNG35_07335 [Mesonia sp. K7]
MNEAQLLTFEKLFDLIKENQIVNEADRKIVEKILEAENDWGDWKTSVKDLNEFVIVLEKEVGGTITKTSLNKLLKRYNQNIAQNAWKVESVYSLLEIFEFTKEVDLRIIFNELIKRISKQ